MQDLGVLVAGWLSRFEEALSRRESAALRGLFQADSHWRDVLALTWRIDTVSGASAIADALVAAAGTKASGFAIDERRAPPREVMRAGSDAVEAIFKFETEQGRGSGVVRLIDGKAWTLLTSLEELKGYEEHVGRTRPTGEAYSRDFRGPNWLDKRQAAEAYVDRDPEVIVVGGGHAGLSIAARLAQLDVDTLIVDREERIGDNWRKRYHALVLHNQVHVNHLPYMPFPATWPAYIPKDKLAGWFEAYVESLELNFWTSTEFEGGSYDDRTGRWTVKLRRNGEVRTMRPRHIVLATGVSGIPSIPAIPMLEAFKGTVVHSSRYESSEPWRGKKAIVIGTGNSGHDIAQDLYSGGAQVALVQRSPTLIVNVEPSAQLPYALYDEGPSLEDCDLITVATPLALGRKSHQLLTEKARQMDRALLDGLERVGFRLTFGDDGTGWQYLYLTRGGGYYFNVGCSDLLIERKIRLLQYADIDHWVSDGAQLKSGDTVGADLIVLATGYKGQEALVARLFGDEVARKVGPIWGFGEGQELRNMFMRTPQPGLYFIAGSLAQCRIYSKYLALQIKAREVGLVPQ
ncbi:MAG TPA: NAD(P)/FAD-dependent oxidoreductase [Reyranella sp.]|jgi:putative flavoprotein involved in K+ transport|nr:NAD(P)/FAD-dependent oxidoreductase [Reyranella sp.]